MFNKNGFVHFIISSCLLGGLGGLSTLLAGGLTGGAAAFVAAHHLEAPAGMLLATLAIYVHNLIATLSAQGPSAGVNQVPTTPVPGVGK